jgi:type I restriction enzyme S subunit
MKYGLTETTVENICAVFARFPEIEKAILYGSRAKGNFKTGSDIDLMLYGESLMPDVLSAIASALDDLLLPYTIDLSVYDDLSHAKLREHIERVGVVFYERANRCAGMKKGWEVKKLGEVCDFGNGLWTGKKPPFIEVGVIRNTNFTKDCHLDCSDIAFLNVEQSQFAKRKLKYGDIILEKSGGGPKQAVGRVVIFDKHDGDFSFSNFTSLMRVKNAKELNFNYLHKYLCFSYLSGATEKMQSHSTGIRNLKFDEYKQILVPLPPLPEQKRIVGILDKAFAAISTAKANAEKNLANARELFESYLQSVFANPGDEWEEKKLGECFKLKSGDNLTSKMMTENGKFPVYGGNGIAGMYDKFNLSGSNIIVGRVGALCGNVRYIKDKIWLTDNAFKVADCKYDFDHAFLTYLLNFKNLRGYARQAAQPVISNSSLEGVLLEFPKSKEEQKRIVAKFDALSSETKKLEAIYQQKLADLDELKKSVLQKAFNGELPEVRI